MEKMQRMVREFHTRFGCLVNDKPTEIADEEEELRLNLIEEEFNELRWACGYMDMAVSGDQSYYEKHRKSNLVEIADAIGDLLYVVLGTAVAYGIDCESLFEEIHRSNMSKAEPDGTVNRREDGKVIKSANYSPARVAAILELQKARRCGTCCYAELREDKDCITCWRHIDDPLDFDKCHSCRLWYPTEESVDIAEAKCAKREESL